MAASDSALPAVSHWFSPKIMAWVPGSIFSLLSHNSHVLVLHAVIHGYGRGRRCTCMDVRKCKTPLPGEPAGCDKSQCSHFTNKDPNHVVSPTLCHRPPYHSVLSPLLFLDGEQDALSETQAPDVSSVLVVLFRTKEQTGRLKRLNGRAK
ncbi:hypothetical protein V8C44DRAFT_73552 [Trichoderma aethiopicum]